MSTVAYSARSWDFVSLHPSLPRLLPPPHAGEGARVCARIICGLALAAGALLGAGAALAGDGDSEGRRFVSKDWELACDNTRACRAAGYQAEGTGSLPAVSLLITRAAGPDAPVAMTLKIEVGFDEKAGSLLQKGLCLQVGAVDLRGLKTANKRAESQYNTFTLTLAPEQARAVLSEMLRDRKPLIWFGDAANGNPDGRLSLAGLNAVLLKMDEWQGRVGTPGALVRRGDRPESSVLPPVPMPVVKIAAPPAVPLEDGLSPANQALIRRILPHINLLARDKEWCELPGPDSDLTYLSIYRLTDRRLLLELFCETDVESGFSRYWIVNDKPPYAPQLQTQLLDLGGIGDGGYFDPEAMSLTPAKRYEASEGYCGPDQIWHFNGQKFILTRLSGDTLCRGFFGGAWNLPTYITRVVRPKSAASKPPKP